MSGVTKSRQTRRNRSEEQIQPRRWLSKLVGVFQTSSDSARERRSRRTNKSSSPGLRRRKARSDQPTDNRPPVLVRRGLHDMATPLRGATKRRYQPPRRRFDLTLNVPGAEVRLPSMPIFHVSWRFASSILVALMALSLYFLLFSSTFQAEMLEVEGMQRFTMSDLTQVLDITGEPVVNLDPRQIQGDLLATFPDLKEVHVSVGLPASVKLVISERQPVVAWERNGETVWVDAEGVVFPQRGESAEPLLRVIAVSMPLAQPLTLPEGDEASETADERLDPKMIELLLSMSQYMPADTNMVYNGEHGFGWGDDRGWQVFFGLRMKDIEEKLVIYQAIVERLQAEGISPALISMEYLHAPYYRMER